MQLSLLNSYPLSFYDPQISISVAYMCIRNLSLGLDSYVDSHQIPGLRASNVPENGDRYKLGVLREVSNAQSYISPHKFPEAQSVININ